MRAVLRGYYGKGNFGDDVLLKVSHGVLQRVAPNAEIAVRCDPNPFHNLSMLSGALPTGTVAHRPGPRPEDYLPSLLGKACRIVQPGNRERFDIMLHGGGGVFFDYGRYGWRDRLTNTLIRGFGFGNFVRAENLLRALLRRQHMMGEHRLGWGIGVGTFSPGSPRLRAALHALTDFDNLVVRDTASLSNLRRLSVADHAVLGSDLAFLDAYWVPPAARVAVAARRTGRGRNRLGLVLRDWLGQEPLLHAAAEALPILAAQFDLTLFVFDRGADTDVLALAERYPTHVWSPPETRFDDYCKALADQDVIVTSRAHGAICGAVLGVPALVLEIEPKLRTIHAMLPRATRLVPADAPVMEAWLPCIEALRAVPPTEIDIDVARNRDLVHSAVAASLSSIPGLQGGGLGDVI